MIAAKIGAYLLLLATVLRFYPKLAGRRRNFWQIYLDAAVAFLTTSVFIYRMAPSIDHVLRGQAAFLLMKLSMIASCASCVIYVNTLKDFQKPRRSLITGTTLGAAAVMVILASSWVWDGYWGGPETLWVRTPISARLRAAFALYASIICATASAVCLTVAEALVRILRSNGRDAALVPGLVTIGASCLLTAAGSGAQVRSALLSPAPQRDWFSVDNSRPPILVGLGAGFILVSVLPFLALEIAIRRQLRQMRPLWQHMLDIFPEIALKMPAGTAVGSQHTRAYIEIHDGLRLSRLPHSTPSSPRGVAQALSEMATEGSRNGGGVSATTLLPRAMSPAQDVEQIVEVAKHFRTRINDGSKLQTSVGGTP